MTEISKRIVIGLVGEAGSGKDTVAGYLHHRYGAKRLRIAEPVKQILGLFFERFSKEDQQWLAMALKERFGADVLLRALKKHIDALDGIVCINGIRFLEDATFVKSFPRHAIFYITADAKTRWQRMSVRGEKTDDDQSFGAFQAFEIRETERHIPLLGQDADCVITNTGDMEELLKQIDAAMATVLEHEKR